MSFYRRPIGRFAAGSLAASLLVFSTGCAARSSSPDQAPAHSEGPVWQASPAPLPVGELDLVPGEEVTRSLIGAAPEEVTGVSSLRSEPEIGLELSSSGTSFTIRAGEEAGGTALVLIDAETAGGGTAEIAVPVRVTKLPLVSFTYEPAEGKEPRTVAVAGEFNGWNATANLMTAQADGSWEARVPVGPGEWSYKFVIDGEWISDPANPRTDATGYGNSLVTVEGTARESLSFSVLSSVMRGGGSEGGFVWHTPEGDALDPDTVTVVVNNQVAPQDWYIIDPFDRKLRLDVPARHWYPENYVSVLAADEAGNTGIAGAHFDEPDAPRSPRDEVIYFPFTDRFRDGDPSNNPVFDNPEIHPLATYHGGDWAGIREKIESGYFTDIGVTSLWISPPNENTMKAERDILPPNRLFTSYHGYWPTSLTETNPAFGTMEELRALVDAAHEKDIAVLLDFVANHVHEDHPLFQQNPDWATPPETPDGRLNIRLFDEYPLTTWFDTFLPTYNYEGNDELMGYMVDNAVYWLRESGADGFRHDAVKHIPQEFWRRLTARLRDEFGEERRVVYQVGETISDRGTINAYVGPDMMDGQFDFPLLFTLQGVIAREDGAMSDVANALLASQREYPPAAIMSPLLGNHDVSRFMGIADGDLPPGSDEKEIGFTNPPTVDHPETWDKLGLGFALIFAAPGPPTVYYGDEIGLTGAHDPDNRRSMPWEGLSPEQTATREMFSTLTAVRHRNAALRRGHLEVLHSDEENLVLARVAPEQVVLAAFSRKGGRPVEAELPDHWQGAALRPLTASGLDAGITENVLRLEGPERSWGYWEVTWP